MSIRQDTVTASLMLRKLGGYPLSWEHINLTGDYVWRQSRKVERGKFRPLPVLLEPWRLHATDCHFSGQPVTTPRETA